VGGVRVETKEKNRVGGGLLGRGHRQNGGMVGLLRMSRKTSSLSGQGKAESKKQTSTEITIGHQCSLGREGERRRAGEEFEWKTLFSTRGRIKNTTIRNPLVYQGHRGRSQEKLN